MSSFLKNIRQVLFLIALFGVANGTILGQKMTVEDVVAKHLDCLGSAEARAGVKSRVIQGSVVTIVRSGGGGQAKGGAVLASEGVMSLMGIVFGPQDYGNEKAAFDGKKLTLGELRPGTRTQLGGFLQTHDVVFKEGLIGGTLSSAWPLLDLESRKPKLRYAGTKKIDGKQTHVIEYEPKSGGNLEIRLYFDADSFQHVRTEYQQEIVAATVKRPEAAASQQPTRLKLTETFSDYRKEGQLVLPHSYKINLTFDNQRNPLLQDWILSLNQFLFNKELGAAQFNASAP